MNLLEFWFSRVFTLGFITLILLNASSLPSQAQSRINFRPTSTGAPGNRESGSNRSGACTQDDNGLVALLPETNLAQTIEAYPAIYAYFPNNSAQYAEFALYQEGSNELVYGTLFNVDGRSGLVSIEMPEDATLAPLQVGRRYYWYLSLICDVRDRSGDMTVQGNLERVAASGELTQQIRAAVPSQYPFVYAEAGLWPETVASLLDLNRQNPGDPSPRQTLSDLLRSVGLTALADEPLLP